MEQQVQLQINDIRKQVEEMLAVIEREREREIIARRFGLYRPKQTLEQIGDLLGITRERVRQLEKAILKKLKDTELPHLEKLEEALMEELKSLGNAAKIDDLSKRFEAHDPEDVAHIHLISELSPKLSVVSENNKYHHAVAVSEHHDEKEVKKLADHIKNTVKEFGEPVKITEIHKKMPDYNPSHIAGLASVSKNVTSLDEKWGLTKWPTVNPKNIRDKIYVVLQRNKEPMHFNDIAKAIKQSDFKRKDVTTQAIHNELIKDKRFVLIGRGIYALKEWGYKPGTVADAIESILKEEAPLHRDEIVKRVLEQRQVKETTVLLNLQGKPQFERVAKATYALADNQ